jgi:hypothetical protein
MTLLRTAGRSRGLSMVEVSVSVGILSGIVLIAGAVLRTSSSMAASTVDTGVAAARVRRALDPVADMIREGSLATMQAPGNVPFGDGETHDSLRLRKPTGFSGGVQLAPQVTIRLVRPVGSPVGDVVVDDGTRQVVLVRRLSDFRISRAGSTFTIVASSANGPADDRLRNAEERVSVLPRNP